MCGVQCQFQFLWCCIFYYEFDCVMIQGIVYMGGIVVYGYYYYLGIGGVQVDVVECFQVGVVWQ